MNGESISMKNIIFDIGNVLLSFQPEEFLSQYYNQEVMGDLMTIIFCSDEWVELDLGTMLIDDVIRSLTLKHPHYHDEITFVLKNWTQMLVPIQKNIDIAYQLKDKGYHLYLLSNFHIEAFQQMFHQYDFFLIFEGKIISGFEHIVKPDLKIYELLLKRYHLIAHESLSIDDIYSYTNAAERLGIHGLHLGYDKNLKEELKNIGVFK